MHACLYVMLGYVYPVHIHTGRWTMVACVYTQMRIQSKYRRPGSPPALLPAPVHSTCWVCSRAPHTLCAQ